MKRARWLLLPVVLMLVGALLTPSCQRKPRFGYDFEYEGVLDNFEWRCRTLYRISSEHATSGSKSLELSFHPAPEGESGHYPGVAFSGFDPNWSGNHALVFDAHNPERAALRLTLRIDDREAPDYQNRFNRSFTLSPGDNRIALPLGELVTSGTKRTLNPRTIRNVLFFLANPRERHTLYLDRVRLE